MEGSPIKRPFVLLNGNSAYVQGLANSENSESTNEVATFLLSTESSKNGFVAFQRAPAFGAPLQKRCWAI